MPMQALDLRPGCDTSGRYHESQRGSHPLVDSVLAVHGADPMVCQAIAERAGTKLAWLSSPPRVNGDRGEGQLKGERGILVLQNRSSPFISRFEHPLGQCVSFYKLSAYINCNFWCEYCYLFLTFRTRPFSVHYVNYERMMKELVAFDRARVPLALRMLNLGELGDPLAVDDITEFTKLVIPFVAKETRQTRLLFLTKSDQVENLLGLNHGNRAVISFSLNTDAVFKNFEHRAASPAARIKAARRVQDAGYEVRIRIDPIIYYSTWKQDYRRLVEQVAAELTPSVVTLGEYRPAQGLLNHIRHRFPDSRLAKVNDFLVRDTGKLRYPEERRVEMFSWIVSQLRRNGILRIGLCKESPRIWRMAGLVGAVRCNCLDCFSSATGRQASRPSSQR